MLPEMFFKTNDEEHDHIEKTVESLTMGGVILTETTSPWIWALACDATNDVAVKKLIAIKQGLQETDHIVVVQDEKMLEDFVCQMPTFIRQYMHTQNKYITLVHPIANHIAPSACSKDGSVPVRLIESLDTPAIQMARHVLRLLGKPIFVSNAAIGDGPIPTAYEEINPSIKEGINFQSQLVFGIDETGEFSTIIKYDLEGHITIVRKQTTS